MKVSARVAKSKLWQAQSVWVLMKYIISCNLHCCPIRHPGITDTATCSGSSGNLFRVLCGELEPGSSGSQDDTLDHYPACLSHAGPGMSQAILLGVFGYLLTLLFSFLMLTQHTSSFTSCWRVLCFLLCAVMWTWLWQEEGKPVQVITVWPGGGRVMGEGQSWHFCISVQVALAGGLKKIGGGTRTPSLWLSVWKRTM